MAGKDGGVQARFKKSGYKNANYFQCAAHRLNLVLETAAKVDQNVSNFFDHLDLICTWMGSTALLFLVSLSILSVLFLKMFRFWYRRFFFLTSLVGTCYSVLFFVICLG